MLTGCNSELISIYLAMQWTQTQYCDHQTQIKSEIPNDHNTTWNKCKMYPLVLYSSETKKTRRRVKIKKKSDCKRWKYNNYILTGETSIICSYMILRKMRVYDALALYYVRWWNDKCSIGVALKAPVKCVQHSLTLLPIESYSITQLGFLSLIMIEYDY